MLETPACLMVRPNKPHPLLTKSYTLGLDDRQDMGYITYMGTDRSAQRRGQWAQTPDAFFNKVLQFSVVNLLTD